jgi:hypothetical protein
MNEVSNLSAINKSQLQLNIQECINFFRNIWPIMFPSTVLFSTLGLATLETCILRFERFEKLCVNSAPEIAKLTVGLPYWLCVNTHQPRRVHHSILFDIPHRNYPRTTAVSWLNVFRGNKICINFHNPRFSRPITRIHIRYVFPLQIKRTS